MAHLWMHGDGHGNWQRTLLGNGCLHRARANSLLVCEHPGSLVAAIFGSVAFLTTISRSRMTIRSAVVGGVLMGASIAAMHSAALTAFVAPAVISYPWQLHAASFGFGILVSAFALLVGFRERFHAGFTIRKSFPAFILGCGIHLLRPSAMLAMRFRCAGAARCALASTLTHVRFSPSP